MKQQNNFDKNLSKKLSQEELDFDPMAWEMMEAKLDEEEKRKAPLFSRSKWGLFLLAFLITSAVGTHYLWNSDQEMTSDLERRSIPPSKKASQKVAKSEKDISPNNSPLLSGNANSIIESQQETETIQSSNSTRATTVSKKAITKTDSYVQNRNQISERQKTSSNLTPTSDINKYSSVTSNYHRSPSKFSEGKLNIPIIKKGNSIEIKTRASLTETSPLSKRDQYLSWDSSILTEPGELDFTEVQPPIERPNHQINISIGAGMANLDIEAPLKGDLMPVATHKRDQFLAASYLNRSIHPRIGLELGAQLGSQTNRISKYVLANDEFISEPAYGSVSVASTAGEIELDLFANVHYYLPINRRTELDLYAGYYAANPFESSGSWGSSNGTFVDGTSTRFLSTDVAGNSGSFEGGKIKVGLNFNVLTNKINTVSFGISYMHEVVKDVNGTYTVFETTDNANTVGKLSTNGSGLKVQLNYSFGLGKQIKELRYRRIVKRNKWYLATRYDTKKYLFKDELSKNLIAPNPQRSSSILIGHYINNRWALEMGLEQYQLVFSTPSEIAETPTSFNINKEFILSIPMAIRYDAIQANALTVYGKGVISKDIRTRIASNFPIAYSSGSLTDEDRLLLNAGLEIGAEYKLFGGLHLGIHGKYNQPFSNSGRYQYPKVDDQGEFFLEDVVQRNQYFGLGVELKYLIN